MVESIALIVAVLAGVTARALRLPPMVGFLLAGFSFSPLAVYWPGLAEIDFKPLVDAGFTLLLFTIGLKLDLRSLVRPFVWGVTVLHMGLVIGVMYVVLLGLKLLGWSLLAELSTAQNLTIGFALSFSSTVFAVKVLEERGEMASLHGKTAIGILVMQDILAVIYLAAIGDGLPTIYAPLVLLLIPLRPYLEKFLARCGHAELLVLAGITLAYACYGLFEAVGMKGNLGALFMGAVLAGTRKGMEMAKAMLTLKDLLLIGFFLSIGQYGLPDGDAWLLALMLSVLLLLKPVGYYLLLTRFHLRAQTAWLGATTLNQFSEFGLIVVSIATAEGLLPKEWLVILAIAVALSFVISSAVNLYSDILYSRWRSGLLKWQSARPVKEQQPIDIGKANILVMGMGRLGTGAYDYLQDRYGNAVVGFDENESKVISHNRIGRHVFVGDASDFGLWQRLPQDRIRKIILALSNHTETVRVTKMLRAAGYTGVIAAVAKFDDHLLELKALGVIAFNFYAEAGAGFADHVVSHLEQGLDDMTPEPD